MLTVYSSLGLGLGSLVFKFRLAASVSYSGFRPTLNPKPYKP